MTSRIMQISGIKVTMTATASRLVRALGWLVAIRLITWRQSAAEHVYYDTFASLTALQVFADFGINRAIVRQDLE